MMSSVVLLTRVLLQPSSSVSALVKRPTTLYEVVESLQHAYPSLDDRVLAEVITRLFDQRAVTYYGERQTIDDMNDTPWLG